MKKYTLGIDVGTSAVKTGFLDLSNYELSSISVKAYSSQARQDSDEIWRMTAEAIQESVSILKGKWKIAAIGLSGQMHGTVLYDDRGIVMGPIINWKDDSCNKPIQKYGGKTTIERIAELLGEDGFDELGIDVMASGFFGATLFYLKEHEKPFFSKVNRAVLPTDFIRGKLLGKNDHSTDQTNAFSTGLFNTRLNEWHKRFINMLGLPIGIFPQVFYTSDIAGKISDEIADLLGIEKDVPIIYGGGDNQMSMLGSGLITSDSPVLINIGTGSQISRIVNRYRKITGTDTRSFFDGNYALVGASLGGGTSYQWLKNKIKESDEATVDFAEMDALAAKVEPGCDGLRFCTGPSRKEPNRIISFSGNLQYLKSIGHMAGAVMEGVVIELREFYRLFGKDESAHFIAAGNALQKSAIWLQIAADILGKPFRITDSENAVFGAALMAGRGIGIIKEAGMAIFAMKYREITPKERNVEAYRKEFNLN